MAKTLKPALIGDPNSDRFKRLKNFLDEEYGIDAVRAKTFDEAQKLIEESNEAREQAEKSLHQPGEVGNGWSLIFISDELCPIHTQKATPERVKIYFTILDSLNKWGDFNSFLISSCNTAVDWRGITPPRIVHLSEPPKPGEHQGISRILDGVSGLERVASAAPKVAWDKNNLVLREQIRSLSEQRSLRDGESHLARLISRCLDCSTIERVEIKQLGQGRSGASVFRLRVETKPNEIEGVKKQEFVLKLCPAGAVWKLESEVRGHLQAQNGLGHLGYRVHIPSLNKAHIPSGGLKRVEKADRPNGHIVRSGHWYAAHYDFLGGEDWGEFVDLETALTASAKELDKKTAGTEFAVGPNKVRAVRVRVLETILRWLCETWYANLRGGCSSREERVLWEVGDAPEQEYISMPPYKLTGRSKSWIQSFLNSQEAEMGPRFFTNWEKHRARVFRLVSEEPPADAQLGNLRAPLPVILSKVHGDLNSNNVLLWLKHKHPFLIDFPFYQEAGHALQDFARLEVEIKFALLDRQKDSPEKRLKAFEHTYSQMPVWQEMEDCLLDGWERKAPRWPSQGYASNVQLCFELVQLVRREARGVQQNDQCPGPAPGDFLTEYWPALLFHTVRAIGYPSLSVFKRLLAVYSSGSILTKLNSFPDLD